MEFARPRRLPRVTLPRRFARAARVTLRAMQSVPRLSAVLAELRDAVQQIERLATFAAQELPEVVYQLEAMREQLAAIERRLGNAAAQPSGENGRAPSRDELRSGSRRPL
ncbi:MAG TPA: hypothetical protein VHC18_25780 [Amycolatopsis sp.]|nr:hypothetical protein [Amycolatopsis sp.]